VGRVALLDVNVLVALFDPDHVHHELAHDWFADHRRHGWATCPITENGLVRVLSNPRYGGPELRPAVLMGALVRFLASGDHTFWPATLTLTDERIFDASIASGHAQLTDVYLLGLAKTMNGCLATFDRTIPIKSVAGASASHLQVIGPG
jgi:toxin-antitoxin system PIN domain toxin